MKTLVVFYSRTGTTKKIAGEIARKLGADTEEIIDRVNRKGPIGFIKSGMEAARKKEPAIKPLGKNPADYDLVIIGTPVWAGTMSSPIRTFLSGHKGKIKKVAFFCTQGGEQDQRIFGELEKLAGQEPKAILKLTTKEAASGETNGKIKNFCNDLR